MTPDDGPSTLHIRCGSDILAPLREAGFRGDFLECSDPICQGPVLADGEWLAHRAGFLAAWAGPWLDLAPDRIERDLRRADQDLHAAAGRYERVVLWFEHDSHDQLILARCLAAFARHRPKRLEMVTTDHHPGPERFIGLGQLPAEALRALWDQRIAVTDDAILAGQHVWRMLREPDPSPLTAAARDDVPGLPFMAAALRRHCQEFPGLNDGLSLTERLVLTLLSEQPHTMGRIFHALSMELDPLPFLGDLGLRLVLEDMKLADPLVFTWVPPEESEPWYKETLTIADRGRAILSGTADYLSCHPPVRFLGGARIAAGEPCWRWDGETAHLVSSAET